jgi:predicted small lipoprotein YifL
MPTIDRKKCLLAMALVLTRALGLAACAAPAPLQKPGADNATMEKDTADCRVAARQEAVRLYPYGANYGTLTVGMAAVRDDNNRAVAEAATFSSCMQNRGYSNPATAK